MTRRVAIGLAIGLAACGRFGFDAHGDGDARPGDGDGSDGDAMMTGASGARWIAKVGDPNPAFRVGLTGTDGKLTILQVFNGTYVGDGGVSLSGTGFSSSALVRYTVDGMPIDARVFDAEYFCELRAAISDGDALDLVGYTSGSLATLGTCSIPTGRQDPIVIHIDAAGAETVTSHWVAGGTNAQAWAGARYGDGELIVSGVYGADLTIGAPLQTAQADPNAWAARPFPGMPSNGRWIQPMVSTGEVHAGPISASGSTSYLMGAFTTNVTMFGTPITSMGGYDTWVAHVDENSAVQFVRTIASTLDEPSYGAQSSIAAVPAGGVVVAVETQGNVMYDGMMFPGGPTSQGLALWLDAAGNLIGGLRTRSLPVLAWLGGALYAAYEIDGPTMIGGSLYTPSGIDAVIVELTPTGPVRLVAALTGTGDQYVDVLAAIGPDALGFAGSTAGPLVYGATTFDTGATLVHVVGAAGI